MKVWKVFLGAGITVLVIGIAVLLIGLGLNGWKLNIYEEKTFICTEQNDTLNLSVAAGKAHVVFYDGENVQIDYPSSPRYGYKVSESGGSVSVRPRSSFGMNWFGWWKIPDLTIKIPNGKVMNLNLDVSAGTASVANGAYGAFDLDLSAGSVYTGDISCSSFTADVSAGSLSAKSVACDKFLFDVSAGSASVTVNGKKSEYSITVDKSAGSCDVSGQQGTVAGKIIDIDVSAGSISVGFTD